MPIRTTDPQYFFSKNDPDDIRLGDLVKATKNNAINWDILGYPDDEGIRINGGRAGAHLAPDSIRKYFYKMTPLSDKINVSLHDIGNIQGATLTDRHQNARMMAFKSLVSNHQLLSLGGGHDYGFSDAAAFLDWCKTQKNSARPIVINFDSHLDVRPMDKGPHSGTPFRRLIEEFKGFFDFIEIGLQPQCNSPHHRQWALDNGATLVNIDAIEKMGLLNILKETLEPDLNRPLWLSIDIDGFTSNEAPGCSQSWTTGLRLHETLPAIQFLESNFKFAGAGIYEVSPPLDQDDRTSKLAALLMYHLIFNK